MRPVVKATTIPPLSRLFSKRKQKLSRSYFLLSYVVVDDHDTAILAMSWSFQQQLVTFQLLAPQICLPCDEWNAATVSSQASTAGRRVVDASDAVDKKTKMCGCVQIRR